MSKKNREIVPVAHSKGQEMTLAGNRGSEMHESTGEMF